MRGFPIVSLGSLVGYYNACKVLMPQFEVDEYFKGDIDANTEFYKQRYALQVSYNWISEYSVFPNNLDSTSGTMNSLASSSGINGYYERYGEYRKVQKLKNIRVDSFYSLRIDSEFLAYGKAAQNETPIEELVINAPYVKYVGGYFNLNISKEIKKIKLNLPRAEEIGIFLRYERKVEDIYLNINESVNFKDHIAQDWPIGETLIHVNDESQLSNIVNIFNTQKHATCMTTFMPGEVCSFEDFDIRYWSKYENETGLDVGLLEGSNLL